MLPALRVTAVLHALSLALQPILAGLFLSGQDGAIDMHATNAMSLVSLCLVQTILAFLMWRRKSIDRGVFTQSLALLVLEVVQMSVGFGHVMWLHIPLGTALFAGVARLMPQIMRSRPEPAPAGLVVVPADAEAAG